MQYAIQGSVVTTGHSPAVTSAQRSTRAFGTPGSEPNSASECRFCGGDRPDWRLLGTQLVECCGLTLFLCSTRWCCLHAQHYCPITVSHPFQRMCSSSMSRGVIDNCLKSDVQKMPLLLNTRLGDYGAVLVQTGGCLQGCLLRCTLCIN